MRINRLVAAAAVTIGLGSAAYAAEPVAPLFEMPGADSIIEVQRDCHRDSRRHYLDEFGRRVWHHHTRRCNIRLDEDVDDYDYDYRRYPRSGRSGCFIAGSPPLTFEICP
jgi:hypothetical protein